jgi:superfamily II DNA or RNA helicase
LVNIEGSAMMTSILNGTIHGDFYFVNHQTLQSYARENSWNAVREFFKKISVGIKVFDEAHLEFKNVLMVDFFSNIKKTFYLTANFERSDKKEARLFSKVFSSVKRFGEDDYVGPEKRKHIVYIPVLYNSNPSIADVQSCMNAYGFSTVNFCKYALHGDQDNTMLRKFFRVMDNVIGIDGKILVTVPRIEDTIFLRDKVDESYPKSDKLITTINSTNQKDDNELAKKGDIICTTIKSCGTGVDIKGLRVILNLEPFSSQVTANQLAGRLREYAPDKDTYFFDFIDIGFYACERQYKMKLRFLKKKCKEIKVMSV